MTTIKGSGWKIACGNVGFFGAVFFTMWLWFFSPYTFTQNPPITPIDETAAAKYRSNLCALRLARLSNAVGPRLWDETAAEQIMDSCMTE